MQGKLICRLLHVVPLTIVSLVFLSFPAMTQDIMLRSHSSSMEPVDILLDGKVHLRIPKAYLIRVSNWFGKDHENVSIEAVLPDMRPIKPGENRKIDENLVVSIWLQSATDEKYFKNRLASFNKIKPYLVPTGFELDKLSEKYHEDKRQGRAPSMAFYPHDDTYIGIKEKSFLLIRCERRDFAKCRTQTIFSSNIVGSFSFDKAFIPARWKEIDSKINDFINNFIVSKSEGHKK